MGYARIVSGGTDGRYRIELDYGSEQKTALLAALTVLLARLDLAMSELIVKIAEADAKEAAQILRVEAAQAGIIAAMADLPPGSPRPDTSEFKFEVSQLAAMQKRHAPLRLKLDALKFDRAQTLRRVAYWTAFDPLETRDAWCADLTEDGATGSYVATVDIPGESALIVLAPGCRPWAAGDGLLTAREIMSPAQAFLNAAMLPGWQKFMPTFRWGTCTAINYDTETMSVSLAEAVSSAQRLPVNQTTNLTGVPVVYMSCNAQAFEVGDRVVVQFIGQSWASPRVIGFLDTPKSCRGWSLVGVSPKNLFLGSGDEAFGRFWEFFSNDTALDAEILSYVSEGFTYEFRVDRGSWVNAIEVISPNTEETPYLTITGVRAGYWRLTPPVYPSSVWRFHVNVNCNDAIIGSPVVSSMPEGSILEFRVTVGAVVLVNVAIQNSVSPTYLTRNRARILAENAGKLLGYDLFVDSGT